MNRTRRFWGVRTAALSVLLLAAGGCAPVSEIRLLQPHLNRWQRDVRLQSEQAWWSPGPDAIRVLAEFPLPGASTGKPMYLLYLRLPPGPAELTAEVHKSPRASGFLIQLTGDYAGLAQISGGKITLKNHSSSAEAPREIQVEVRGEDGSRITGRLLAKRNDWQLFQFEHERRPADVQALLERNPAKTPKP